MANIFAPTEPVPGAQRPPLWRTPIGRPRPAWPGPRPPVEPPPEGGPVIPVSVIELTPTTLTFAGQAGSHPEEPQFINVRNIGEGKLIVSMSDDVNWLIVSPLTLTAPSELRVVADPGALVPGFYNATITIASATASNSPQSVVVGFSVIEMVLPILLVDPDELEFSKVTGAANPADQTVDISFVPEEALAVSPLFLNFEKNQYSADPASQEIEIVNEGTGDMEYIVSDDAPWLTVVPTSGDAPDTLTVSVVQGALAPGTYNGNITITALGAVGSPKVVPVEFVITPTSGDFIDVDADPLDLEIGETIVWTGTEFVEGEL